MNSGMRLSAVVIALVVIATGIYYATLDDGENRRASVAFENTLPQSEAAPSSSNADRAPAPIVEEPSATPVIASVADTPPAPVAAEQSDPASSDKVPGADDPGSTDGGDEVADPADDSDTTGDPAGDQVTDAVTEPAESTIADPDGTASEETGADTAEPEIEDPNLEAAAEEPAAPAADGATSPSEIDGASPADTPESSAGPADSAPRAPGRSVQSRGLGGHVIVSSTTPEDRLLPMSVALGRADPELVIVPVDGGYAWMALPASMSDNGILEGCVRSTREDSGIEYILVREDRDASLSLEDRIAEAIAAPFLGGDSYRVRYRVDEGQIDSIRRESAALIDRPVAWVVDGAVVAISRPRIAISLRSMIPISVDEKTAIRLAGAIVGNEEGSPLAAGPDEAVIEVADDSGKVAVSGRPARAGELPEDAYTIYVVKASDTPSSIAREWFGDANKYSLILNANPLVDPKRLMPGDKLRLPPRDFEMRTIIDVGDGSQPVIHIVQSGENLSAIALAAYGDASLWPRIYEANKDRIKDPSRLVVGTELIIP